MTPIDAPIRHKKFHDVQLWCVLLFFFIAMTVKIHPTTISIWAFILCCVGFAQGIKPYFAIKSLFLALLLSISIWLLNALFHAKSIGQTEAYTQANHVALKIWAITWIALLSSQMINQRDVISTLLQRGWLSPKIAYAIMVGVGSIELMSAEAKRIGLNARLRGLSYSQRVLQWIPLLVFALRHSQRGAMSLRARGLNTGKTFYYNYQPTRSQNMSIIVLLIFIVMITICNEYRT